MRALACLLVIFCHSNTFSQQMAANPSTFLYGYTDQLGTIGVELFFLISGFLMSHLHSEDFGKSKSSLFMKKRLIRIIPMYYMATLLTALAYVINPAWFPSTVIKAHDLLMSLMFLPSFYLKESDSLVPVLGVGWTLCFEMMFYVVFALALNFRKRTGMILIYAVIISFILYGQIFDIRHDSLMYFYSNHITIYFLIGIAIEQIFRNPGSINPALGIVIIVAGIAADTYLKSKIANATLLPIVFIAFLKSSRDSHYGYRWISLVAVSSYSAYLFHRLIMGACNALIKHLDKIKNAMSYNEYTISLLMISVVVGWVIYTIAEKNISKFIKSMSGKRVSNSDGGTMA